MIIGFLSNLATYEAAKSCMKGIAMSSGSKVIDKVLIPAGIFILASMAGDKAQEYTEDKVKEVKETVNSLKNIKKDLEETKEPQPEPVVENIFDTKEEEEEENGESDNA